MQYKITGKQIDIGEALQTHVRNSLNEVVGKFAGRPTDANVVFSKSGHEHVCETTVHLSTGLTAQAKGHDHEIYVAFDKCAEKMEKQLRRYKRRLKDHYRDRKEPVEVFGAASYILAASEDGAGAIEPETLQPMIIAEMETQIPSLSVGEAVMQQVSQALVVIEARAWQHVARGVDVQQTIGSCTPLVAQAVRDCVEDAGGQRGIPDQLHAARTCALAH